MCVCSFINTFWVCNLQRDLQVPESSVDVKIGTLIALIVEPGADWKGVTVPADVGLVSPAAVVTASALANSAPASSAPAGTATTPSHQRSVHETWALLILFFSDHWQEYFNMLINFTSINKLECWSICKEICIIYFAPDESI